MGLIQKAYATVRAGFLPRRHRLTYDAVENSKHRKLRVTDTRGEDHILTQSKRDKMSSQGRSVRRNIVIARWMISSHLDYTTRFRYQAKTTDKAFNKKAEAFIRAKSRREVFDPAGRHSLRSWMRLTEAGRVETGDELHVRLASGAIQSIAGTRIKTPDSQPEQYLRKGERWKNGVRVNSWGRATGYAVWAPNSHGQLEFLRVIPAQYCYLHAYFTSADNEVRGISPLASALNMLEGSYKSIEYALAKAKVSQMLALLFKTDGGTEENAGASYASSHIDEEAEDDEETEADELPGDSLPPEEAELNFDEKGVQSLNLDENESVELLESNNPSNEFQAFQQLVIMYALKALNIPYCWLDEKHTNMAGQIAALQRYRRASLAAIEDNQEMLMSHTEWWLKQAVLDGELTLPDGYTVETLPHYWQPMGVEWWDKSKQVIGDLRAIAGGLDSPQGVCSANNRDFEEILDEIEEAQEMAAERGITLNYGMPNEPRPSEGEPRGQKGDD